MNERHRTGEQRRIVVIFFNIGPYHESRLSAAADAAHERGWEMHAVQGIDCAVEYAWGSSGRTLQFPVHTLIHSSSLPSPLDMSRAAQLTGGAIGRCLDELQPHVVFVPGWGNALGRAALCWCRRHRVPAVVVSDSKQDDEKRHWWKEQLKAHLYVQHFSAALVAGEAHRDYAVRLGISRDNVFTGYDVVDNDYFAHAAEVARRDPVATRARQRAIPRRPYFLSVTRFLPRKNIERTIRAYAAYRREVSAEESWDLVICGSGEEERLRAAIAQEDLEGHVHLPGFKTYAEIGDWYGLASAFVHSALREQWGLVINEACASGLPILASRTVGATPHLVRDGENGFLFDPEDEHEITHCLIRMHQARPMVRAAMGHCSQSIVADWGPDRFGAGFVQTVEAACRKERGAPLLHVHGSKVKT